MVRTAPSADYFCQPQHGITRLQRPSCGDCSAAAMSHVLFRTVVRRLSSFSMIWILLRARWRGWPLRGRWCEEYAHPSRARYKKMDIMEIIRSSGGTNRRTDVTLVKTARDLVTTDWHGSDVSANHMVESMTKQASCQACGACVNLILNLQSLHHWEYSDAEVYCSPSIINPERFM